MASHRFAVLLMATMLAVTACSASDRGSSNSPTTGDVNPNQGGWQSQKGVAAPQAGTETLASRDPQSTFALDVDTASYTYAARQIADGSHPDRAAIRPEEFVNAFDPGYPQPRGDGFSVQVDGATMPESYRGSGGDVRLMRIGLATRAEDAESRADAALTFVIDVSGSMADTDRLDLVQDALHTLIDELRPTDSVAIVSFNDSAKVEREMTKVANGARLHEAVDRLHAGGSTNLEAGLVRGYEVARDGFREGVTNRVIILSDGLANTGSTKADPILRRVRAEADKQIALLGVGVGSEYGDALMERLADRGDGFVVYVADRRQARDVFVHKLPATLAVRALDAKAQVTFDPETVESYRLVGYADRAVADSAFRDDRVDGGEVGPGHSVTALYVVRLRPDAGTGSRVAQVRVRWLDPHDREASEAGKSVSVRDIGGRFTSSDPYLQVAYAAAFFAEALKADRRGETSYADLAQIARDADRELDDRAVGDLVDTITRASRLDG